MTGLRRNLYIWSTQSCLLVKTVEAHTGRINKMIALMTGGLNCIITSSVDKTIKIWDLDSIEEPIHTIERHDLAVEEILVSSHHESVVLTKCRNSVLVWDTSTGSIRNKIAESMLGTVVSLARLTGDGQHLLLVESGNFFIWNLVNLTPVYKEIFETEIIDIILHQKQERCFIVTKQGESQNHQLLVSCRDIPGGSKVYDFKFPVLRIKPICITYEGAYLVTVAWEKKVRINHVICNFRFS